jgi:hypothetical protein
MVGVAMSAPKAFETITKQLVCLFPSGDCAFRSGQFIGRLRRRCRWQPVLHHAWPFWADVLNSKSMGHCFAATMIFARMSVISRKIIVATGPYRRKPEGE